MDAQFWNLGLQFYTFHTNFLLILYDRVHCMAFVNTCRCLQLQRGPTQTVCDKKKWTYNSAPYTLMIHIHAC
ncbi:hypothetical protein HanLR1_Chr08g0284271 [Helianthus annuus]|nr:hypothetical protein HanLR1_Chr08g0284271 [Helianthus annuus]